MDVNLLGFEGYYPLTFGHRYVFVPRFWLTFYFYKNLSSVKYLSLLSPQMSALISNI